MLSTMSDYPLTIGSILEYGVKAHGTSLVQTWTGEGSRTASFCEVGARAKQLARALERLGIRSGDRVGTLCWNTQEHLEAYYAVPQIGAVLGVIGPALTAMFKWGDWEHPLYVLILYAIIAIVDGFVLQPFIMKRTAKVPVWASILAPIVLGIVKSAPFEMKEKKAQD